jgi:RNA polymerase sigma factor (sigma-70 family)
MEDLDDLIRRAPGTAEGAAFAAWLRDLERTGDGWEALFDALVPQCEHVAREFADVMGLDEARGACMSLAYERSVGAWLDGVERGTMARSFATLVGDQLRDHLRAMRRTRKRRASLDREHRLAQGRPEAACDPGAEPVSRAEAPDEATHLRELVDRLAAAPEIDERTRRVLRCLAGGHDQREIARLVGISEPTVSRSVARLRGALAEIVRADRGAA